MSTFGNPPPNYPPAPPVVPGPPPAPGKPPTVVAAAAGILFMVGVLGLLNVVVSVVDLGALCACCGGIGLFALNSLNRVQVSGDPQAEKQVDLAKALADSIPGWQKGLGGAVAVLQLLGYLAVAILLALPPANAFFRRATPVWQPPTT